MIIDFANKTALICGSSHGIGRATAELFAESNCSVIILGRNLTTLKKTLKCLKRNSNQFHQFIVADLSKPKCASKIFNDLFEKISHIDILVNNSSGPLPKNLLDCEMQDFQSVFNQHFLSVHLMTQKAITIMKERKFGRIINILGTSIKEPIPGLGLATIKAATSLWAKTLSMEVGKYNITVNNVLPGPTDTREFKKIIKALAKKEKIIEKEYLRKVCANIDLGKIANPKEIAYVILFIASDYASYITGTNIFVDGGYSIGI